MTINMQYDDHKIVESLLHRDDRVTRDFFYKKCYPLFKSVFDNYHTDCETCVEFINEIYIYLLTPNEADCRCKLEQFKFQSTLFTWLKTVTLFYCYKKYRREEKMPTERIVENYDESGVRIDVLPESISIDESSLRRHDTATILQLMPNKRYSTLIRLRYLEGYSNEETAAMMGMNMNTFYNKHKLAKDQFLDTLRKEDYYG